MKEIIISRIKRKRQILFDRDDGIMIELSMIINDMSKEYFDSLQDNFW